MSKNVDLENYVNEILADSKKTEYMILPTLKYYDSPPFVNWHADKNKIYEFFNLLDPIKVALTPPTGLHCFAAIIGKFIEFNKDGKLDFNFEGMGFNKNNDTNCYQSDYDWEILITPNTKSCRKVKKMMMSNVKPPNKYTLRTLSVSCPLALVFNYSMDIDLHDFLNGIKKQFPSVQVYVEKLKQPGKMSLDTSLDDEYNEKYICLPIEMFKDKTILNALNWNSFKR